MTVVDLSHDAALSAAAEAAIWTALGSITGVSDIHVSCTQTKDPAGVWVIEISAQAWAPSLHIANLDIYHRTGTDPRVPFVHQEVLDALEPVLERQRARARAGVSHGIARPLSLHPDERRIGGVWQTPPIETRHLHIDVSMAAVAADNGLVDLPKTLRSGISNLLDTDANDIDPHDGSGLIVGEHGFLLEKDDIRAVGTSVMLHPGSASSVRYEGPMLQIKGVTMAETILAAAIGRPLGDLVRLHPALDLRRVERAIFHEGADGPTIDITLIPEWVPWSTIEVDAEV